MSQDHLERISNRMISERSLRTAVNHLEGVKEPPTFWIQIANDRTYSPTHRAICICQFFKRHIKEPLNIVDLARLLDGPDWINSNTVTRVSHLKGEIPVEWNLGESVLAIRLFPGETEDLPVLYLRFSQSLGVETFLQMMKAPQSNAATIGVNLLEGACG